MGTLITAITGNLQCFSFPAIGIDLPEDEAFEDPNRHLQDLLAAPPEESPLPQEGQLGIEIHTILWLLRGFKPGEPGSNEYFQKMGKKFSAIDDESKLAARKARKGTEQADPAELLLQHRLRVARMNLALQMRKEEDLAEEGQDLHFHYFTPQEAEALLKALPEDQSASWNAGRTRPDREHLTLVVKEQETNDEVITTSFTPIKLIITKEFLSQIETIKKEAVVATEKKPEGSKPSPKSLEELITKVSNGPAPYFLFREVKASRYPVNEFLKLKKKVEALRSKPDSPATDLNAFIGTWCIDEPFFEEALRAGFSGESVFNHLSRLSIKGSKGGAGLIDDNHFMAEIIARTIPIVYMDTTTVQALSPTNLGNKGIPFEQNDGKIKLTIDSMIDVFNNLKANPGKVVEILKEMTTINGIGPRGAGLDKYIFINKKIIKK